jgi:phage shock protein A
MVRFDQLERRVDYAEGRADSMSMGDSRQPTLADEIAALEDGDSIEAELTEMKRAMGGTTPADPTPTSN